MTLDDRLRQGGLTRRDFTRILGLGGLTMLAVGVEKARATPITGILKK